MAHEKAMNGVDLERLNGIIDAVQSAPRVAEFRFGAEHEWQGGTLTRSTVRGFYGASEEHAHARPFVLDSDESALLLGEDRSANPGEYVLHALAACLTTSLVLHAAARGIPVRRVEASIEGDVDLRGFLGISEDVRNGYQGIRVALRVEADAPDDVLDELVRIARARSPVFDIVSNPVPVTVTARRAAAAGAA